MTTPVGVLIGRWQVDRLHDGHIALIDQIRKWHPKLLLLLGVRSGPTDPSNALDFRLRERMLRGLAPDATILPLLDRPGDDDRWSDEVDALIRTVFPTEGATIYGGRESFIPHYKGTYPTKKLDLGFDAFSGTQVRQNIAAQPRDSEDFRAGVIYAKQMDYPRVSPAVDVAMLKGDEVCLIRKPNERVWRFPGGFVGAKDASYEAAAKRELHEETGLVAEGGLQYVGSFRVDDPRVRGSADTIFTTFYTTSYTFGKPSAGDDASEADWFRLATLSENPFYIMPEHRPLLTALCTYLSVSV